MSQHNQFQKEKDYFCSELVYEAFKEGENLTPGINVMGLAKAWLPSRKVTS